MNEIDGQTKLIQYLEKIDNSVDTLKIKDMNGDLDLYVIKEANRFPNLKYLEFTSDNNENIRSIINIPQGLETFVISGHSLTVIVDLPNSLKNLNVSRNSLKYIDLQNTNKLETLNCSYNKINTILNIPNSLKELNVQNNDLRLLDLQNLTNLTKLECSNNNLLIIKNIPESLKNFSCENSPLVNIDGFSNKATDEENTENTKNEKVNYIVALNNFFKLKNKYETNNREIKKKVFMKEIKKGNSKKIAIKKVNQIKNKCIQCGRPVGSIFSNKNRRYTASCGDKIHPCGLNIEIFRGDYVSTLDESLETFLIPLNKNKEEIIIQKMDTLFSYISETQSVEKFKSIMKDYNTNSDMYNEYLKKYNDIYFGNFKQEVIKEKTRKINQLINNIKLILNEYKTTDNVELLRNGIDIYIKDLMPEINNLRMKKYDIMEMDDYILFQKQINNNKIEEYLGELPNVINYNENLTA